MELRKDVTLGEMWNFPWPSVGPVGQPDVAMAVPGPPVLDEATAETPRTLVANGAAGGLFLATGDCAIALGVAASRLVVESCA